MPKRIKEVPPPYGKPRLSDYMAPSSLQLLTGSGNELIQQIGIDVARGIILDILTGKNLRDSTETLTRRRIAALNLAIASLFLKGSASSPDFVSDLPALAAETLRYGGLTKAERWLAQWILGLTDKSVQNVLRDNKALFEDYRDRYIETCNEIIATHKDTYGELAGVLKLTQEGEIIETQAD